MEETEERVEEFLNNFLMNHVKTIATIMKRDYTKNELEIILDDYNLFIEAVSLTGRKEKINFVYGNDDIYKIIGYTIIKKIMNEYE